GAPCRLGRAPGRASLEAEAWERGARLRPGGADEAVYADAIVSLIKREAKAWFAARLDRHCGVLEVPTPKFGLGDPKSRWGSCTPAQGRHAASIRLSWRLALAPPAGRRPPPAPRLAARARRRVAQDRLSRAPLRTAARRPGSAPAAAAAAGRLRRAGPRPGSALRAPARHSRRLRAGCRSRRAGRDRGRRRRGSPRRGCAAAPAP